MLQRGLQLRKAKREALVRQLLWNYARAAQKKMLGHFAKALKPGGKIVIADFYRSKRGPQDKDMNGHIRADKDAVIEEIEANGYKLISQNDHGSNQYVVVFARK